MNEKKYQWLKIADSEKDFLFSESNLAVVEANGKKLTVAKYRDKLFACAYACPHAGGLLNKGDIDAAGNVICPLHRYKFSLLNGRNISGEGFYLKTYPVEVRGEGIFAGIVEKNFLDF